MRGQRAKLSARNDIANAIQYDLRPIFYTFRGGTAQKPA
jgi:hypothetical protein